METTTLKSFATKARTDLIKEVGARVAVVLAENSLARVESLAAVRRLEEAIVRDGRDKVIDRVAYTWFNRIIALRFMDANGYTPSAIVSPEAGRTTGQPEVLAEAKAGSFDSSVVPEKTQETITALLNRTRPSQDPDGEAYGLLLEAYCRSWHKAMPFMFEREGDYTELLIPAALLAVDSVRDRAVRTLTEEVCRDVEVIGWLYQFYISDRKAEVFDGFKKNKKAGAAEIPAATQLFTPHWIVRYLVENSLGRLWLLNNPSSRLAEQMDYYIKPVDEETDFLKIARPEELKVVDPAVGSGHMLTYAFDLLYAIYTEKGYDPAQIPGLILQHNLYGTEIDPRAGALAAFALTMKAAAKRKLFLKNPIQPNVCVLENVHFDPAELDYLWSLTNGGTFVRAHADEFWNAFEHADTFGSLIQPREKAIAPMKAAIEGAEADGDILAGRTLQMAAIVIKQAEFLSDRYLVAVANPPYAGLGNMNARFVTWARKAYPATKTDLYSMFIERAIKLTVGRGLVAMVTMQSWMFLRYFEALRSAILDHNRVLSMAHFGARAFDSIGGEVVGTTAFVIAHQIAEPGSQGVFIRLVEGRSEAAKSAELREVAAGRTKDRYVLDLQHLARAPGRAFVYWATAREFELFETADPVSAHIETRVGLITGDNDSFLRRWHEVALAQIDFNAAPGKRSSRRWFPYVKGGEYRRWAGNYEYVVNWLNDGSEVKANIDPDTSRIRAHNYNGEYAFRAGFTWSGISSNGFAVRDVPQGFMFDTKGPMGFPIKVDELRLLQGLLNSAVAVRFMRMLAPTLDFNLGHVMSIPFLDTLPAEFAAWADECVQLAWQDWDRRETAWGFDTSPLVRRSEIGRIRDRLSNYVVECRSIVERMTELETLLNRGAIEAYGLGDAQDVSVSGAEITLDAAAALNGEGGAEFARTAAIELVSYAVGCMFGRYSLDRPGLILADQGSTLQDYLAKVPTASFMPDQDNVIPIVDGDWFEDDIVARFRTFLRVAFGEEHFEENLQFVTESLGVKDIRDYFVKSFYDDHVRRYKKRPIYWLFRSPKGSFSALIYLHRYSPSTASTVLTSYLREFIGKLEANLEHQGRVAAGMGGASAREVAAALKEADRLRKVLVELRDYEHDVLFPLAGQQIELDLDDGVLVNYQKLGPALKDIGLKKGGGGE
ncbi:BREX-1 system adenine-specific DNA-methyltransferase PglX [Microbacterium memoriense]|uniref:site-specific DNA-methyltransferase (adenine-specific) n=1 Tax=Microbacterium memoriense TaxID=2978350 RepID=A0ABT2PGU4_9MICO|nr:BREX-1 system adenine-specific DNA-methyltransferase PglX [Microbacterium memoriense]MCT9002968.1 BREX-1 system adenine-specific DNA-methyltransferase PglX [Microbacterium memoriense]